MVSRHGTAGPYPVPWRMMKDIISHPLGVIRTILREATALTVHTQTTVLE